MTTPPDEPLAGTFAGQPGVKEAFGPGLHQGDVLIGELHAYEIRSLLGEKGGFGSVWEVAERKMRQVAPKSDVVALRALKALEYDRSFSDHEYNALQAVNSANVIRVRDRGTTPSGKPFLVLDLVEGARVLADLVDRRALQRADLGRVAEHVARGLADLHSKGVCHLDVKPKNILYNGTIAMLIDLGVARIFSMDPTEGPAPKTQPLPPWAGPCTPQYAAPEQIEFGSQRTAELWRRIGPQADIFAFGIVLIEMVTGRKPDRRHLGNLLRIARRKNPALASIIARCTQDRLEDRYANGHELYEALRTAGEHQERPIFTVLTEIAARMRPLFIRLAVGLVVIALLAFPVSIALRAKAAGLDIVPALLYSAGFRTVDRRMDITGTWSYRCEARKEKGTYAHGGIARIEMRATWYGPQWHLVGTRQWIERDGEKTDVTYSWETNWATFTSLTEFKYSYHISTKQGFVNGYADGNVVDRDREGRPTRLEGTFYQLPPLDPMFGGYQLWRE